MFLFFFSRLSHDKTKSEIVFQQCSPQQCFFLFLFYSLHKVFYIYTNHENNLEIHVLVIPTPSIHINTRCILNKDILTDL